MFCVVVEHDGCSPSSKTNEIEGCFDIKTTSRTTKINDSKFE